MKTAILSLSALSFLFLIWLEVESRTANPEEAVDKLNEIVLHDSGTALVSDLSALQISVPAGMKLTRIFKVRSDWPATLANLRVISTCGCTASAFSKTTVAPGEVIDLECVFQGKENAGNQNVRLRILSPEASSAVFEVPIRIATTLGTPTVPRIIAAPASLAFNERWESNFSKRMQVILSGVTPSVLESLAVEASSQLIDSNLEQCGNDTAKVSVVVAEQSTGTFDHHLDVSYPAARDKVSIRIPIRGQLDRWVVATPSIITFDANSQVDDAGFIDEVTLTSTFQKGLHSDPQVTSTGDCKILLSERIDAAKWRIKLKVERTTGKNIYFGTIEVNSGWAGEPLVIPVNAAFSF